MAFRAPRSGSQARRHPQMAAAIRACVKRVDRLNWINSFSLGDRMKRFMEGEDRKQVTLLPECLDDFVAEDKPVRIIEAFVQEHDLEPLGFNGTMLSTTDRPSPII